MVVVDAERPITSGDREPVVPLIPDAPQQIPGQLRSRSEPSDHRPAAQEPGLIDIVTTPCADDRVHPRAAVAAAEGGKRWPAGRQGNVDIVVDVPAAAEQVPA